MAKIMLVEDDNNLREIYEARLLAEGYQIVSAKDGEEALAMAVKEKPDLIISDVMMPKISGFDMLDILRSTPETKNIKVIMMTALSQAEDKSRADKLGADRYLVKSQVTLEDVAKVAREVLDGEDTSTPPAAKVAEPAPGAAPAPPAPASTPTPAEPPVTPTPDPTPPAEPPKDPTPPPPAPTPPAAPPGPPTPPTPTEPPASPAASASVGTTSVASPADTGTAQTTANEEAAVDAQIQQFIANSQQAPPTPVEPVAAPTPPTPAPEPAVSTAIPVAEPPSDKPVLTPDATDSTSAAADKAANLAHAVNDILQKDTKTTSADSPSGQTTVAGKKIIKPLNDISTGGGPDLNKLLEKEEGAEAPAPAPVPAPIAPTPTPNPITPTAPAPAPANQTDSHPPGHVIQPGNVDPNSIAL